MCLRLFIRVELFLAFDHKVAATRSRLLPSARFHLELQVYEHGVGHEQEADRQADRQRERERQTDRHRKRQIDR